MKLVDKNWGNWAEIRRRFSWQVPRQFNMGHAVCDSHTTRQKQVALWYENSRGETSTFTFGQIRQDSNRLANVLHALGLNQGDRVGIILPQRPETAIAHIATYKMGAIALPLSILFGPDALEYRLKDSGARVIITDQERWPVVQAIRPHLPALEHIIICGDDHDQLAFWPALQAAASTFNPLKTQADDPAFLIYTSGTTGPPKGALHAHRSLLGHLTGFELSHNFFPQPQDCFWTPADWAWAGGLLDGLLPAWFYGIPILAYEGGKFDPEKAFYLLHKYNIRNSFIPPTALKMMMQVPHSTNRNQPRLRSLMSAGESVGGELLRWGQEQLQLTINEMWGQTEVNYLVGNCAEVLPVKAGSIGKPYPGHHVDVVDAEGHPLPSGEIGELACRAGDPVMFLTYWQNEAATQEKFMGDWFTTGDLGYRDEDGYLWFMGRKDDIISSAGYRIGPTEIEECLLKHPAVAQAAVIGIPDELRGHVIKAFIIPAANITPSPGLVDEIQSHVRARLAAYEYPREIEFLTELPMTTTGKIRRVELRRRETEQRDDPT